MLEQVTGEKMGGLKIDLVINLPMRIKYRRSASIVTEGARTRRTAVDHGGLPYSSCIEIAFLILLVPLITDIKCAKLFVEAMRVCPLGAVVSEIDMQSSLSSVKIRGFVSGLLHPDNTSASWIKLGYQAVANGFTSVLIATDV